jgi:hypothetical protein
VASNLVCFYSESSGSKADFKRMMPEDSVYGDWPASGEIDLAESKGNSGDDYPTGRDSVVSALV